MKNFLQDPEFRNAAADMELLRRRVLAGDVCLILIGLSVTFALYWFHFNEDVFIKAMGLGMSLAIVIGLIFRKTTLRYRKEFHSKIFGPFVSKQARESGVSIETLPELRIEEHLRVARISGGWAWGYGSFSLNVLQKEGQVSFFKLQDGQRGNQNMYGVLLNIPRLEIWTPGRTWRKNRYIIDVKPILWIVLFLGVALGAAIHFFGPEDEDIRRVLWQLLYWGLPAAAALMILPIWLAPVYFNRKWAADFESHKGKDTIKAMDFVQKIESVVPDVQVIRVHQSKENFYVVLQSQWNLYRAPVFLSLLNERAYRKCPTIVNLIIELKRQVEASF